MGHILVVDDEPQIRRVMRTTLVAQGYEVSDARTGDEALDLIRSEKYDLVLLDVNMPGISGVQTCREIRLGPTSLLSWLRCAARNETRSRRSTPAPMAI